jgi:hypothetical protein
MFVILKKAETGFITGLSIYILKILIPFEIPRSPRMGRCADHEVGSTFLLMFPCKKVQQSPLGIN